VRQFPERPRSWQHNTPVSFSGLTHRPGRRPRQSASPVELRPGTRASTPRVRRGNNPTPSFTTANVVAQDDSVHARDAALLYGDADRHDTQGSSNTATFRHHGHQPLLADVSGPESSRPPRPVAAPWRWWSSWHVSLGAHRLRRTNGSTRTWIFGSSRLVREAGRHGKDVCRPCRRRDGAVNNPAGLSNC